MKNNILFILLFLLVFQVGAQNRKVHLLENAPLEEVLKKARKAEKNVLLDFGSPRCSPCLFIKNKVFTVDSVADFMNDHLVCADYTEGDEKKRLSGIYKVYSEPVLLIVDPQGRLMHRMEGKCNAGEMLSRVRQGLSLENNLAAQQLKYEKGERTPEFIVSFLETLRIAGLREQQKLVLGGIFSPDFDVACLKEKKYWDIFLRYSESPVSKEGMYVFENRHEFYKLFGEEVVRAKIDYMYAVKVRQYTYGTVPPVEAEEYRKILSVLQACDYEKSTEWLIYLMPVQYKFKDWVTMAKMIQAAIELNAVMGKERQTYMIMMSRQICWYSDDEIALRYAVGWLEDVLKTATEKEKISLSEERQQILDKIAGLH